MAASPRKTHPPSNSLPDLSAWRPPGFFSTQERLAPELEALDRAAARRFHGRRGEAKGGVESYRRIGLGESREGRPLWGLRIGRGRRSVSLTAGAHADEPAGPVTAVCLARALVESDELAPWLESHRFFICPQVNPDGAERNRIWFVDPPDPLKYFQHVQRELPGDDVEFGYPRKAGYFRAQNDEDVRSGLGPLRAENAAVADFLEPGSPFVYHASLHSMGISEGAWFLIGRNWVERAGPLMDRLEPHVRASGLGWHDIERRGDKGFSRIRRGFCTTPNHLAMRRHFLEAGDPDAARKFHPSSMEFAQSLGGDPLVMVSELPMFVIRGGGERSDPPMEATPYTRCRDALMEARRFDPGSEKGRAALQEVLTEFGVEPVPFENQVRLQGLMFFEALRFLEAQ